MKIIGEKIYLKIWNIKDISALKKIANDKTIYKFTKVPYPYTIKHAKEFIKKSEINYKKNQEYGFGIFDKKTNELVGSICIRDFKNDDKRGNIGYWIGKEYRRKGYVTEAAKLIINYGFNKLKLNKIEIDCSIDNKPGNKFIKKLGAKKDGLLREHYCGGGRFHDVNTYSILKREWRK